MGTEVYIKREARLQLAQQHGGSPGVPRGSQLEAPREPRLGAEGTARGPRTQPTERHLGAARSSRGPHQAVYQGMVKSSTKPTRQPFTSLFKGRRLACRRHTSLLCRLQGGAPLGHAQRWRRTTARVESVVVSSAQVQTCRVTHVLEVSFLCLRWCSCILHSSCFFRSGHP